MMKNTIISAINTYNSSSGARVADWKLVGSTISREEHYFVRANTEQARLVDETTYTLTLYVDSTVGEKKTRGEATVTIQPSLSPAEVAERVKTAAYAASKSRNPWFELPGPASALAKMPVSGFESMGAETRAETARSYLFAPESDPAIRSGADRPEGRINALELFLAREEKTFLNSKGQEFVSTQWRGYSEYVVDAIGKEGPVELFDAIEFADPDRIRLGHATGSRLAQVRDRAIAIPMPKLSGIPVILGGGEAEQVFSWFYDNSTTGAVFTKISPFTVGMNVQQKEEGGTVADPLDVWAEPGMQGFPDSWAFDPDGFPLERTRVIEGGVLKTLVGSVRHADWLGVPRKGAFALFSVSPGKMSLAEMRARPHLEPVMFSDFRLDPVTGDFGAEIRLAYWFDGARRLPVTGGSISGAVSEFRSTMRRSSERAPATRSLCPVAVLLDGLAIAGVD